MPRKLSEIDSQEASTLVCLYFICQFCKVIDRNRERSKSGFKCTTCGKEGNGASLAFPVNMHILVDMAQQSYHAKSPVGPISGESSHDIATVLHFCTLREALINNFLIRNLKAKSIPAEIIERLLEDNKLAHQKFGALFASVTGEKWNQAVISASSYDGYEYAPVSELMIKAATSRNRFLHDGNVWEFDRKFSEECINSLGSMFRLFVALHNVYTHSLTAPHYQF